MEPTYFVRELEVNYKKKKSELKTVDSPRAVFQFLAPEIGRAVQERFIALYLNNKNRILAWSTISVGTVCESIVHPRDIFRNALLCNASSIVLAHNHPSGDLNPSREDIETTKRLVECGKTMGIEILDHVIISDISFLSLKETGYV